MGKLFSNRLRFGRQLSCWSASLRNSPTAESDVRESQWLMNLHTDGLLREVCTMRTYWRQRNDLVRAAARHIQRIQKALTQMNIQLANVLSDVGGMTGQAIIQVILAGERDPRKLAGFRDFRVKASEAQIAQSLEGNWQEDLLFVLKQEQDGYEFLPPSLDSKSSKLWQLKGEFLRRGVLCCPGHTGR